MSPPHILRWSSTRTSGRCPISAIALAMAGCSPRRDRRARLVVAEYDAVARPVDRDPSAVGGGAPRIFADVSCVHSVQRVLARSLPLQYCGESWRAGARSIMILITRRRDVLGEHRRSLQPVQHAQGRVPRHEASQMAGRAEPTRSSRSEALVSAEFPARELARLSLLGRRDRATSTT
jgi:hypothetical protein